MLSCEMISMNPVHGQAHRGQCDSSSRLVVIVIKLVLSAVIGRIKINSRAVLGWLFLVGRPGTSNLLPQLKLAREPIMLRHYVFTYYFLHSPAFSIVALVF